MTDKHRLTAADGHAFDAYVARPSGTPLGGLVICQEVMGVNGHMRAVADRFAEQGYLAVAPAFFDRREAGVELGYSEADVARGRAIRNAISWDQVILEVEAAVTFVGQAGKVAVVGYCWGGSIAWLAACRVPVAAIVGYYGGQIHALRNESPRCPVLLHFGEHDHMVPMPHVDAIRALHPGIESHVYPAGHGFDCEARVDFHADSARRALERTLAFLAAHL